MFHMCAKSSTCRTALSAVADCAIYNTLSQIVAFVVGMVAFVVVVVAVLLPSFILRALPLLCLPIV